MTKYIFIFFASFILEFGFSQIPTLHWSTYHGGSDEDGFRDMATDGLGNVYVIGSTKSTNAISTTGSYQTNNAGANDVYIAKYDKDGNRVWSTYFGGTDDDIGQSIDLDLNGNIFITGQTYSTNGIATVGSHQNVNNGNGDAFVAKFSNNGNRIWGSYFGGNKLDFANDLEVDHLGNPIIIGWTTSANGIATPSSFQNTYSGQEDVLLAKFDNNGQLLWSTYFGDAEFDSGLQVESDLVGNVVISGWTSSRNNIATPGVVQSVYGGKEADAFLAVFTSTGSRLWSTYYGGSGNDYSDALFVNDAGDIYLSGSTESPNNIATIGAFQSNVSNGFDAFLARFSITGTRLWSTYFGGNDDDTAYRLRASSDGAIYMLGHTKSTNIMATAGAFQSMKSGGQDVLLSRFENSGTLTWSTYYGGSANDFGYGLVFDNEDNIFISGLTEGSTNLSTSGSAQPNFGGGSKDGFVTKFAPCTNPILNFKNSGYACSPVNYVFEFELLGQAPFKIYYSIDGIQQTPWTTNNQIFNPIVNANLWKKIIQIDSVKSVSCKGIVNSKFGFVQVRDSIKATIPIITCDQSTKTYTFAVGLSGGAFGDFSSVGSTGGLINNSTDQFQSFLIPFNDPYFVQFTESGTFSNCDTISFQGISGCIDPCINFSITPSSNNPVCEGSVLQLNVTGGSKFQWKGPNGFSSSLQNPSLPNATSGQSGNYVVTATDVNNCSATATTNVIINAAPLAILSSNSPVCNGSRISFQLSGGLAYQWSGPNGFSSTIQNPIVNNASILNAGTYQVTVTGANQCTKIVSTQVVVNGQLNANITSNSPVCEKSDIKLKCSNGVSFQWSGPNGFSSTSPNPTIPNALPSNGGNYQLAVTDQSGCSATLALQVVVNKKPIAKVTGKDSICNGETIDLSSPNNGSYKWSTGATANKINIKPIQSTIYTLIVNENNCYDTTSFIVSVKPKPILKITNPSTIFEGETKNLLVFGADTYKWSPSDGLSCFDCPNPVASPAITTTYCVQGNLYSCTSEICTQIEVAKKCKTILSNVFSPNGDNENKLWCSPKLDCISSQKLTIYDRWGNVMYSQVGEEVCWDGKSNGQLCQNDVYTYFLQLNLKDGEPQLKRGSITLVK